MAADEVEASLKRELMVKESETRVTASVAAASAATTEAALAWKQMADKEDDITGEDLTEVISITFRFAGLLEEEIVRIFQNKFKPINLYRLCQIRRLRLNSLHDQDRIGIEDNMLKLQKTSGTYKDFGTSFYEVWADAFHNYTIILVSLFGRAITDLHSVLAEFYTKIYKLSIVYEWQEGVLPMAIKAHTFISAQEPTDPSKWVIPEKFQGWFCTARTMIGMGSIIGAGAKRKRSRSPAGAHRGKCSGLNNPSISCELFNKGGCNCPPCHRANKCKECGSRDHGLSECTMKGKTRS